MNGSKLAPEAARIALLDRINYSQSALQKPTTATRYCLNNLTKYRTNLPCLIKYCWK